MQLTTTILFFLLCLITAIFLIYGIGGFVWSHWFKKPIQTNNITNHQPVSIIIAACNEEPFIRNKLEFLLAEEEWILGSELIVVSAGSQDRTNEILKEFEVTKGIITVILEEHVSKPMAVNIGVQHSQYKILVFSDCRQDIMPGSIKKLAGYFNESSIGAVSGTIVDTKLGGRVSFFRTLSNTICFNDSNYGSSLTIHGALYAQRRELFTPFPKDIIHDDLFAAVSTISRGKRLIQAKDVVIKDISFGYYYNKNRLERLVLGLLLFLFRYWPMIIKMPFGVRIRFIVFKYLKLLLPIPVTLIIVIGAFTYFTLLSEQVKLIVANIFIAFFLFRRSRESLLLFIRITWHFVKTILKFFFLRIRTYDWKKEHQLRFQSK